MHACMYVRMCGHVCVHAYTRAHACILYMHLHVRTCVPMFVSVYMCFPTRCFPSNLRKITAGEA